MEAWFLREWQRNSPWQLLLRPVSWFFAILVFTRRRLFAAGLIATEKLPIATIVVGNITVGGTGKTPLVLAIVEQLSQAGRRCGIITRGYTRQAGSARADLPIHIEPFRYDASACSDEALLLANRSGVPVYAAADRVRAGRALLKAHPEVDIIVCDDGLQHYALGRDIELCVVDGGRRFGNGGMLPAGPLREPLARLATVSAIVVHETSTAGGDDILRRHSGSVPSFGMRLGNEAFVHLSGQKPLATSDAKAAFSAKRVVAVAGTGYPQRFFEHLRRLGISLLDAKAFPDHHPYMPHDIASIEAEIVLMTEKDAVKCTEFADPRIWYMRVDAIVPDALGAFLLERLSIVGKS
jgi:tetraacyldisaccharide 4'-kinase